MSGADGSGSRPGGADWRRTLERAAPAVACVAVMAVADPSTWWGWTLWLIALVALVRMITSAAWRASLDPRRAEGPDGLPLPHLAAPGAHGPPRPPARDVTPGAERAGGGRDGAGDDDLPWVLGVGGATIWVEEVGHAPLALVHVVRACSGRDRARALRAVTELPGPLFSGLDPDAAESLADALRRAGARVGVASLVPSRRARWWDVAWWDVPWWTLLARRWTDLRAARARRIVERGAVERRAVERGAEPVGGRPGAASSRTPGAGEPAAGRPGPADRSPEEESSADGLCCSDLRALLITEPGGPGLVVRLRPGGPGGFGLRVDAHEAAVPIWRCPWCGAWLDGLR